MTTTTTMTKQRRLEDLRSVGPATMDDFNLLGVSSVEALASCDAEYLYAKLCELRGETLDRCCEDVFSCAIAQARRPNLPQEQCDWWWWSDARKKREARWNHSQAGDIGKKTTPRRSESGGMSDVFCCER